MNNRRWLVLIAIVLGLSVVFAVSFVTTPRFFVREYVNREVELLWSEDEAFVLIGSGFSGEQGSWVRQICRSLIHFIPQPDQERMDLIVVHIHAGKLERYTLRRFGFYGGPYPINGNIYYEKSTTEAEWPAFWRWSGNGFDKITKEEALPLRKSFSLRDDLLAEQGWKAQRFLGHAGEVSAILQMRGRQLRFAYLEHPDSGAARAMIREEKEGASDELLAQATGAFREVDQATYEEIFK
jgi:hypothetical protein